jgi:hypothetical protein
LAWRRSGVSSGALPEAAAAGLMSQISALMFSVGLAACTGPRVDA